MNIIDDKRTDMPAQIAIHLIRFFMNLGSSSFSGTFLSLTIILCLVGIAGILTFFEPDMNFARTFLPANFSLDSNSSDFSQILFYFGIFATILGFIAKNIVNMWGKTKLGDWGALAAVPAIIAIAALDFILFAFGFFSKGYADALFMSAIVFGILTFVTGMAVTSLLACIAFEKCCQGLETLLKENNK